MRHNSFKHLGAAMHQISKVSLSRGVNVAALSSGSGQCRPRVGNSLKLSNLGLDGRLVKKGLIVSHHGMRYLVIKVNRGYCYGNYVGIFGVQSMGGTSVRMLCESVQVVA